ncbi:MAG TPA: xanthine dehydrogenase family protein molybdopterin-binding subunit [bacterium]|nr:xanthine dehydrogenase family protein molybdopterin-binding subunit [bacterium]
MMHPTIAWIGRPVKRREDLRFLQGQARYVDDLTLPGMTHLVVVRSAAAHARLRAVNLEPARRSPGVVAVVTGRDLAGQVHPLPVNVPEPASVAQIAHPVLAGDVVRYVGEPIAGVLAESRAAAEDAAHQVDVQYDPLPAVTNVRDALAGKVRLHDSVEDNVLIRLSRGSGDVEAAFRSAERVVRERFHLPRIAAAPMEPRGAVAAHDPGPDLLTVWLSAQGPYRPRAQISQILARPEGKIRVVVPDVGGAFGSKGTVAPEAVLAAWLAIKTGRPVKWGEDRRENLMASYQGRGIDAEVEVAVDHRGRIAALRATVIADVGAYLYQPTTVPPSRVGDLLTGAYDIPVAKVDVRGVATNKVPTGPYRGAGRPEAAYIVERMVDRVAGELGLDPVEVRRRNLIPPDRFPYRTPLGSVYDSGDYGRALDRACVLAEYARWREEQRRARSHGRLVGIGVATYIEPAGSQVWESAAVSVTPQGRVVIRTGSTAHGQGHDTTFAQIAAEALQIPIEAISIEQGDSARLTKGMGTFGSRSTTIGGSALWNVLQTVKTKMVKIAAHLLEAAEGDIRWGEGRLSVQGAPARALTFQEVAAAAVEPARLPPGIEPGLEASGTFSLAGMVYPSGAYIAVVEVEPPTGLVRILRLVAVDDAGRIINPLLAEGQVIGATVQGLGQVLAEEVVYDDGGQLLTGTFADYALLRAAHVPHIESEFLETPSPLNPLGAKGIGEAGTVGAPPALANAVIDALAPLGVINIDLPLTQEKLWRLTRTARTP